MRLVYLLCCYCIVTQVVAQQASDVIITQDIDHFWEAYDKIITTKDSAQQYTYLQTLYLDKGSPGLEAMRQARRYTAQNYIDAINQYPAYWNSIRSNTYKASQLGEEIAQGVKQLQQIYPTLKPAKVYFTIGVFRSPGTTMNGQVLIGAEMVLGDENVVVEELPERLNYVKNYLKQNPIEEIVFLNVHEFVHTQQKEALYANLLVQCLREGVAEFIAEKAMQQASTLPALAFGKKNTALVKERFTQEMFSNSYHHWLWNDQNNDFGVRDLGYYVGYAIAAQYYQAAKNKQEAIKILILLPYDDDKAIETFVDQLDFFSDDIATLKENYEAQRPEVVAIAPFSNHANKVDPTTNEITVTFSKPMDTRFRGFDYGPLGEKHVLRIEKLIGFSEDKKIARFAVNLQPNQQQQVLLTRFRDETGRPLQPYLIDITTGGE
ncbi:MAG: hypothetical protein ACFB0B_05485 [Thermonemataceae bacterium]